ncbi:hypothetical protein L1049_028420 [Liquidambar formosana]|uniref:Protein MIS12 homolog n=1 Tax=Liquidambar formosana TaxID=63359 RepID=A0AAP0RIQ4_LIQFO
MEGSESEAIFDSLNLNPQLFINEVLNSVDDLLDGAFDIYQQQASTLLRTEATDRSNDLTKGVAQIRNMVQGVLDKRLGAWEDYCLRHCFNVPEGFSLPKPKESPVDSLIDQDALCDPELDSELDSLRNKLAVVGKESSELNRELRALEKQSVSSDHCAGSVNEALQLYQQNSVHDMFQEMIKTASELRKKMEKLKSRRMEETERIRKERIFNPNRDLYMINRSKGPSNAELEDLQGFVADLKNM